MLTAKNNNHFRWWSMSKNQPSRHPISALPALSEIIDCMLEMSLEQLQNMRQVIEAPHIVDDETLAQIIEQYSMQCVDHWLFEEQFNCWKRTGLTALQEKEVDLLMVKSDKLQATNEEILKWARSIARSTFYKHME